MLREELQNIKSGISELRKFGITIGILLGLVGGLLLWRGRLYYPYFFGIGITLLFFSVGFPNLLKPIYKTWMTIATLMGWFMTRVILSLLFYLVVTPIGLIARLSGNQFLDVKMDDSQTSYWNYRKTKKDEKEDYEKQF